METYSATLIFAADFGVDVEAESPDEAAEKAYNSDEAAPRVCHQCSDKINIGDCVRVIVYDQSGNEVFDDGWEAKEIERLRAEIDALRKDAERYCWLANDCNGNEQDDIIQWLSGSIVSREDIDAAIDAAMKGE